MAIEFDNSEISVSTASSGGHSHVVASGSNRLMVVVTMHNRNGAEVTYNNVAMTQLTEIVSGGIHGSLWYLVAPDEGTHDIGWSMDIIGTMLLASISLTGVSQVNPLGASDTENEVTSGESSIDLVLQYLNSWTIELQGSDANVTFTQNDSQTSREAAQPGFSLNLATKAHTNPGSTNLGFTPSGSAELWHIVVEIRDILNDPGDGSMRSII